MPNNTADTHALHCPIQPQASISVHDHWQSDGRGTQEAELALHGSPGGRLSLPALHTALPLGHLTAAVCVPSLQTAGAYRAHMGFAAAALTHLSLLLIPPAACSCSATLIVYAGEVYGSRL